MITSTPWSHFVWKTGFVSPVSLLKEPFLLRRATVEEKEKVQQVALLALTMNTEWYSATNIATACIKNAIEKAFLEHQEPSCLVITHGGRIIGVSVLDLTSETTFHLASGPWILMEYRNRGLGAALLYASLQELAQHGVAEAHGITLGKSIAARFIYPKFGGVLCKKTALNLPSQSV